MVTKVGKLNKLISAVMLIVMMFSVLTPVADAKVQYDTDSAFSRGIWNVVNTVGGIGGAFFTLMFLVLTLVIATKSVSPQNQGMLWGGLITCAVAGVIFFSAYFLTGDLKTIIK